MADSKRLSVSPFPGSCPSARSSGGTLHAHHSGLPVNTSQVVVSKSSASSARPNACGPPFLESETADWVTGASFPRMCRRTTGFHAGRLELEGQVSPKPGRQVQLVRDTVPVLLGPGGAQKSDGPSHELQMGGPGPKGHHLATTAHVLSPGRSELMATGTSCSSVRNTRCAFRGPPHW